MRLFLRHGLPVRIALERRPAEGGVGVTAELELGNRAWIFPSDEALIKLLYLALRNISTRWTLPIRDWKAALNRFTIQFEGRIPQL